MNDRPTLVLVWHDGTVQLDTPESNQTAGLAVYLEAVQYGHADEPLAGIYMVDKDAPTTELHPLGMPLVPITVQHKNTEVDNNDWMYVTYGVYTIDTDVLVNKNGVAVKGSPVGRHIQDITIRVDGRA